MEELRGQIQTITYSNEETGYTVARVKVKEYRNPVVVVGNILSPVPGEVLIMTGEWTSHPQYGRQFKIVSYHTQRPATLPGIQKYLGSGLIKGIGPVMAERLIRAFGAKTLDVIEGSPERLLEVDGIGPKRVAMITEAWQAQQAVRRVMMFLQEYEISPSFADKVYKAYGNQAEERIRANPFQLAEDIRGIGFLTADRIAGRLGMPKQDPFRAEAGILHILHETADDGHVYFPYEPLADRCREMLEIDREIVLRALGRVVESRKVMIEDLNLGEDDFQRNHKAVYLAGYHAAETGVAWTLNRIRTAPKRLASMHADKAVAWVQRELGLRLAPLQAEAVRRAVQDKVLVITGGPGTGKTTIIRAILSIYRKKRAAVLQAAPTGRAAKRMTEATGVEARTIHRLLEFNPMQGGFKRDDRHPLDCDLLVIDEASMIDIVLMHYLLKAVPREAALILVGDVDQLPSVGPGNVLGDIIASGTVSVVRLRDIFRQAKESEIIINAHRINQGVMPRLKREDSDDTDFFFIERPRPEDALAVILKLVAVRIPSRFNLDPFNDIQVLSPMHRGVIGAGNLNDRLQETLNPGRHGIMRGGVRFSVGDKVMQIKNNYDLDVFNGDIGRVATIDAESRNITVDYDGRRVAYDFADLDQIVLAYAISVHKSQGSEYPAIVLPLLSQHHIMLQRNLLYTAVTRGKRLAVIVGTRQALSTAVRRDVIKRRYSNLALRLKKSG